jgi:cysteinyl-tRNA synthetase
MPPRGSGLSELSFVVTLGGAMLAGACGKPAVGGPAAFPRAEPGSILLQAQARPTESAATERRRRLNSVQTWGYWLASFEINGVAAAPHDLLVIDNGVSANRRFQRERVPDEMTRLKRRPDGTPRILLSYLSIGEAERYRPYWQPDWYDPAKKPVWLGEENPEWPGNFAVQFWHPEWQQLMLGSPESYLDRIMAQGFDGIYIDRADAAFTWESARPSARDDMAAFLMRLADYARKRNPQFLIVMQNAEELLPDNRVMNAIDGIAKEDMLYGIGEPETPNSADDVKWSLKYLRMAHKAGRKVLVVEYLRDAATMAATAKRVLDEGFVPYFAPRMLNCLNPPAVLNEAGHLPDHPCR